MTQKSLFDSSAPRAAAPAIKANIDGGARGNPGPSAYGVVVRDAKGEIIAELAEYLGNQTNNFAEYSGLLAALEYAVREKYLSLAVISDSELMVKQMKGQYKVKNPGLLELYTRAKSLVRKLEHFSIQHVLRAQNRDADRLVNEILDSRARGAR
ncbi:MAG: ribonuclease HI family protein [Acidobacteriia bacterium]|nr:ribonuclease HI family protein [Terriglobia bacterium]